MFSCRLTRQRSPELVQDSSRDFSVYVLDPLESLSSLPSSSSSQTQHPRGVAVGLGLMSWALRADDSDCVSVTGTIMRMGNGDEALEVIFALREVCDIFYSLSIFINTTRIRQLICRKLPCLLHLNHGVSLQGLRLHP